jgi:hypothetical protein
MNTRSRLRTVVAQASPQVEDRPASLGIVFEDRRKLNRFNLLKDREIKSTK